MRRISLAIAILSSPMIIHSCSGKESFDMDGWRETVKQNQSSAGYRLYSINDTIDYDWPDDSLLKRTLPGVEVARRRARQLAELKWKPYANVPSCYGYYLKGEEQTGIPYSLTYMTHSQLGTQVSLHTYMTAIQNPYSVLYSEDLGKSPYYGGADSAPFYGTTCSNSVLYALGISVPYYTRMFGGIPGMQKAEKQTPEAIDVCDVLWQQGHVRMVYDIEKDDAGSIKSVQLFETTRTNQRDTWINEVSFEDFVSLWSKNKIVRYQYKYLEKNTAYEVSVFVPLDDEPEYGYSYNYDICPTRGDRCSYIEGEDVSLAVLTDYFTDLAVFKDGELVSRIPVKKPVSVISDLPYGEYKACLVRDDSRSGFIHFEVIHADVHNNRGAGIFFDSKNSSPEYIVICDESFHPMHYYSFSDSEKRSGVFTRRIIKSDSSTHFRVFFRGRYGVVASDLQEL